MLKLSAGSEAFGGATNMLYGAFVLLLAGDTEVSLAKRATGLGPEFLQIFTRIVKKLDQQY